MLHNLLVEQYMTKPLVTFSADTDIYQAIKILLDHQLTCAPVLAQNGQLLGMFSEKDGMKVVLESVYDQGVSGKVGDYMTKNTLSVNADASIVELAEMFLPSTVRSFPVYRGNELVGIISRTDVLKALIEIK